MTHSSIGIDDERIKQLIYLFSIITDNRLGNIITAKLIPTQEFLPFWREFGFNVMLLSETDFLKTNEQLQNLKTTIKNISRDIKDNSIKYIGGGNM